MGARKGEAKAALEAAGMAAAEEVAEAFEGIGVYAESGLHAALKRHYAAPGDRFEVSVGGKVVDLVRSLPARSAKRGRAQGSDGEGQSAAFELVEVQTKRLDKIAPKVLALAMEHKVRVVHPVAVETLISRVSPDTGEVLSERKSPKRGDLYSVFDELVMASSLIAARNVTVEVLLVRNREVRCRDGKGSWRRRGDRVLSRDLEEVLESRSFRTRAEWMRLLPGWKGEAWTSSTLGAALGIGSDRARKILYSYAKAGLLVEAGKSGRHKAYAPSVADPGSAISGSAAARAGRKG